MKKLIVLLILAIFIVVTVRFATAGRDVQTGTDTDNAGEQTVAVPQQEQAAISSAIDYSQFIAENNSVPMGTREVDVPLWRLKGSTGEFQPETDSIRIEEDGFVDVSVNIPESGLYELELDYMPEPGRSAPVEIMVQINHEAPYRQAETLILERIWQDEASATEMDSNGNDIRPTQIEKAVWSTKRLDDSAGYFVQPLLFYFQQGENVITIKDNREPVLLKGLSVCAARKVPDYNTYISGLLDKKPATQNAAHIQGEMSAWKTDPTIVKTFDRTSPLTEPYRGAKISLNIIGSYKPGQTIAWTIDAPEDGLYELRFKVMQVFDRSTYSGRTLRIDGEIPFKEAENIKFFYNSTWQMVTLGDGEKPYYVYLTKGEHELSMEVTLGDLGEVINRVDECTRDINSIYRNFLMIMGYTPDIMRDYKLERQLPESFMLMSEVADRLDAIVNEMTEISGIKGTELLALTEMSRTLRDFVDRPYKIPEQFGVFTSDMSALNAWKNDASLRSLDIDYIDVAAPGAPLPQITPTFLQSVSHGVDMFLASFVEDYNSLGSTSESKRSITIWSTAGRDQAQVMNQLVKSYFSEQSGINVEIQLVPGDVILPSTVAGNGPDVILNADQQLPINFALRGAAVDLSGFDGFSELIADFRESALTPVMFQGGVYGLPEVETYPMLFYRKDILEELGIGIPETWDDVLKIIPVLQKNNMSLLMDTGIANTSDVLYSGGNDINTGLDMYSMLLYQRGGQIYEGDGIRANLDGELAIETFKDWCKLYTNYGLPTNFNATYRFRTGESPVVIANMGLYNYLMVSSPEIKGLWGMTTVPGTIDAEGNINKTVRSKTAYSVITKTSKDQEAAWEFIKWWLSADTQENYARDLECLMGTGARYMTANTTAFARLPWATKDLDAILEQGSWTIGIPEVAGGYFLPRHINNAFRSVVIDKAEPRETLIDYANVINEELTDKRREFGLPVY